jgi:hypothetical protein
MESEGLIIISVDSDTWVCPTLYEDLVARWPIGADTIARPSRVWAVIARIDVQDKPRWAQGVVRVPGCEPDVESDARGACLLRQIAPLEV